VFDLSLAGIGGFPNLKRPRVIWTGAEIGKDKLRDLAAGVETACVESEFGNSDKRFSPHLTIGRVKNPAGISGILEKIGKSSFKSEPFVVFEVIIYKSDLSPAGPRYTSLAKIQL
jgi:2'-5' RNA ligase